MLTKFFFPETKIVLAFWNLTNVMYVYHIYYFVLDEIFNFVYIKFKQRHCVCHSGFHSRFPGIMQLWWSNYHNGFDVRVCYSQIKQSSLLFSLLCGLFYSYLFTVESF